MSTKFVTCLVPCYYVPYDFLVKKMFGLSFLPFVLSGVHVLFMLFVFIYLYFCPTRFPFQMIFLQFNSNTTDATSGAGTAKPSGATEFTQELLSLLEQPSSPLLLVEFVPLSLQFYVQCFVDLCLSFYFFWQQFYLSFNLRVPLISSNSSHNIFSSPGPKVHVNYCHHLASVVCRLSSVNFSHFKLLLRNHLADWN